MPESYIEERAVDRWIDRIEQDEKRFGKRYPKTKPVMSGTMEWRAWMARNAKRKQKRKNAIG